MNKSNNYASCRQPNTVPSWVFKSGYLRSKGKLSVWSTSACQFGRCNSDLMNWTTKLTVIRFWKASPIGLVKTKNRSFGQRNNEIIMLIQKSRTQNVLLCSFSVIADHFDSTEQQLNVVVSWLESMWIPWKRVRPLYLDCNPVWCWCYWSINTGSLVGRDTFWRKTRKTTFWNTCWQQCSWSIGLIRKEDHCRKQNQELECIAKR